MTPKIDLVYFNAGGGHRAAALALRAAIERQGWPWHVRLVNLAEVLDPTARFRRVTGFAPEDFYNFRLARGWTLGLAQELRVLQAAIRAAHGSLVRSLARHWATSEPDLVVSLIPNFNRALCDSLALARPGVPFATVLTDLADLPNETFPFWIEPGQPQHLVCPTGEAVRQARAAGFGGDNIWRASGVLLRQAFHDARSGGPPDKQGARAALGLAPERPTAVVMYGGYGSMAMRGIARALPELQLILMCGRNARLAQRLRARPAAAAARLVVEFTEDVPRYMRAADIFIGKPGPGCLSEALHLGLPVITFGNAWTMPQERFNVRWVREHGYGLAVRSLRELPAAVSALRAAWPQFTARVAAFDNRASFDVPRVLAGLLAQSRSGARDAPALSLPARLGAQRLGAGNAIATPMEKETP